MGVVTLRRVIPAGKHNLFDDDPQTWLAAGVKGWEAWFLQERSETARWLAAVQNIITPTLPMASSPDHTLITHGPLDVSPLAIEYPLLSACCLSGKRLRYVCWPAALRSPEV